MIDLRRTRSALGRSTDAASASESVYARLKELLDNRLTSTRAANLDKQGLLSLQYGSVTIASGASSGTATISSVNTARAHAALLGYGTSDNSCSSTCHVQDEADCKPRIELTNATTVTAYRPTSHNGNRVAAFMVPEYRSP